MENECTPTSKNDIAPPCYQRNKEYKKQGMIISSINEYGLYRNIDELKLLVDEEDIHIISINETKIR